VVPPEGVGGSWASYRTLLLAVEVLSPSSLRRDRVDQRRLYQERRVAAYWMVDPEAGLVEVWHPEDERPAVVAAVLSWRIRPQAAELSVDNCGADRGPAVSRAGGLAVLAVGVED
jgi:hypothetical protein